MRTVAANQQALYAPGRPSGRSMASSACVWPTRGCLPGHYSG
jgi:hypothetical protein